MNAHLVDESTENLFGVDKKANKSFDFGGHSKKGKKKKPTDEPRPQSRYCKKITQEKQTLMKESKDLADSINQQHSLLSKGIVQTDKQNQTKERILKEELSKLKHN
jgi:hypothetical protein